MPVDPTLVRERYAEVQSLIGESAGRAGRAQTDITIVAAIKYVETDDLPAIAAAGVRAVGENRSDALLRNQAAHRDLFAEWHFIGHLQTRKVREVVGVVTLIHALESEKSADQIQARSTVNQDVLIEVNVARDPAKYGVDPDHVDAFLEHLAPLTAVRVRGLMTMPAFAEDPETSRVAFAALRELAAELERRWSGTHEFGHLSMGTSQDFLVAVEEGATIVRIGSTLYSRPPV